MADIELLDAKSGIYSKLTAMFNQHYLHSPVRDRELCNDISHARDQVALSIKLTKDESTFDAVKGHRDAFNLMFSSWKELVSLENKATDDTSRMALDKAAASNTRTCISLARKICL